MTARACLAPIRAAVGDIFTDEEIDAMLERLAARHARLRAGSKARDNDPALWREAFESLAVDEARDSLIEARMRAAAAVARARREAFYARFGGDEGQALRTLMVGDEEFGHRRGFSIDAQGKAAEVAAHSEFTRKLQEGGYLSRLADPFRAFAPDRAFEDDVARELAILNGEERASTGNSDAAQVAQMIHQDQTRTREAMNALGAWIGELPGYISRTTHDPIKISGGFWRGLTQARRDRAREDWKNAVRPLLHERTFEAIDEEALAGVRAEIEAARDFDPDAAEELVMDRAEAAIGQARERFLDRVWTDIVSGYRSASEHADDLDGFTPPPSLARSLSGRRVLHWRDADAWLDYNRRFGQGSLFMAHLSFLSRAARSEALMRSFGPSPAAAFEADRQRLARTARDRGDTRATRRINERLRQGEFDQLTGQAEMPQSHRLATVSRAIRSWTQMAKLGGMIFSSATDLGNGAQSLARAGVSHLKAYEGLTASVASLDPVTRREVANLVGEGARAVAGDIAAQFTAPDANLGLMFKAQRVFYRANLFSFWQARLRAGAGQILARHLGDRAGVSHGALDAPSRAMLERYGIDAEAWEMLRALALPLDSDAAGGRVITPDMAHEVDADRVALWAGKQRVFEAQAMDEARTRVADALEAMIADLDIPHADVSWTGLAKWKRERLEGAGVTRALWDGLRQAARRRDGDDAIVRGDDVRGVTNALFGREMNLPEAFRESDIEDARRELMLRAQAYFTDQIDTAMTEPRARERAMMRLGTQTGTVLGAALELFMQFKSFPLSVITRHLGPAIADARARGTVAPIAHFLIATTALGFVAMTMKDLARGLEPQPLEDEEGNPNTAMFLRAFIQGGGAGLYADFVFGDYDRFGRSPWAVVGGPAVGEVERVLRIFSQARRGEFADAGADAVRLGIDNTPFVNLFYTRWALNYLWLYGLQEAISPGYLRRMEERTRESRGGQEFYLPPSEMIAANP